MLSFSWSVNTSSSRGSFLVPALPLSPSLGSHLSVLAAARPPPPRHSKHGERSARAPPGRGARPPPGGHCPRRARRGGRCCGAPRPPGPRPRAPPPPGARASHSAASPEGGCRGRPGPGGLGLGAAVLRSGGPVVGSLPPDVLADGVTSREELLRWFGDVRGAVAKVALVPGDGGGLVSHLLSRGRLRPGPSRPGPSLPRPPRALPPGWRRRRGGSGRRGRGSGVPAPGALKPAPLYAPSL